MHGVLACIQGPIAWVAAAWMIGKAMLCGRVRLLEHDDVSQAVKAEVRSPALHLGPQVRESGACAILLHHIQLLQRQQPRNAVEDSNEVAKLPGAHFRQCGVVNLGVHDVKGQRL